MTCSLSPSRVSQSNGRITDAKRESTGVADTKNEDRYRRTANLYCGRTQMAKTFTPEEVQGFGRQLKSLPRFKEKLNSREAVSGLAAFVEALLANGHSLADVAAGVEETGMMPASTFLRYWREQASSPRGEESIRKRSDRGGGDSASPGPVDPGTIKSETAKPHSAAAKSDTPDRSTRPRTGRGFVGEEE
jgi:hypothetical protein